MLNHLRKIESFIDEHHVLSLATSNKNELSVCNLFYAYDAKSTSFITASSDDTTHIQHILKNSNIAGTIVLETKTIGKIQGLQFHGKCTQLDDKSLASIYFKEFPASIVMKPALWQIKIEYFKMTDNTLGFGKKLIWSI